ncbi:MAG: hypothetical protein HYU27_02650 [Acidobacteria bacterium]|nr:hypothetical protein [Acidobacteriota bacterium]
MFLKLVLFVAVAQTSFQKYTIEGSVVFEPAFMAEPVQVRLEDLNSRFSNPEDAVREYHKALLQIDAYLEENPDGPERVSAETTRAQLIEAMGK